MNRDHLTDIEIQQYCFDPAQCESSIVNHLEHCESCKAKAGIYKSISSEIKNIESPLFDLDLAGLVLSQLPQPKLKPQYAVSGIHFLGFVLVALLCISLYLLQPFITNLFTDVAPLFYWLIVVTAIIITAFQGIEMFKGFQNKMARLNLY